MDKDKTEYYFIGFCVFLILIFIMKGNNDDCDDYDYSSYKSNYSSSNSSYKTKGYSYNKGYDDTYKNGTWDRFEYHYNDEYADGVDNALRDLKDKNHDSSSNKVTSKKSSYISSYNSYDNGYEDVMENDDFDWDRYENDLDYENGVDDAIDDYYDEFGEDWD